EQIGAPLELFDRPANLFVARFIGSPSMNLLAGRVELAGDVPTFRAGELAVPLRREYAGAAGRELVLGVRPEQVSLATPATTGARKATVTVVAPTGTATLLSLNAGGATLLAVFKARLSVNPGDTVALAIDPGHIRLFDRQSGKRI